jgi:hypothetical protein
MAVEVHMGYQLKNPATITGELLDRVNALAEQTTPPTDVEVGMVQFSAKKLERAEPSDFYMLQGLCASLLLDVAGVHANFRRAIDEGGWRCGTAYNYVVALLEAGAWDDMHAVAMEAFEFLSTDLDFVRPIEGTLLQNGWIEDALVFERQTVKLGAINADDALLAQFVPSLRAGGANLQGISAVLRESRRFLWRQGYRRVGMLTNFGFGPAGPCHLNVGYSVPGQPTLVRALEREMLACVLDVTDRYEVEYGANDLLDWVTPFITCIEPRRDLHAA